MKLAFRVVVSALLGIGVYSLLHWLPLHWLWSIPQWVSIAIALITSLVTFLGEVFDWVKKPLEIRKLWQENAKLRREAERDKKDEDEKKRIVRLATPEEIGKYVRGKFRTGWAIGIRSRRTSTRISVLLGGAPRLKSGGAGDARFAT